MKCFNMLVVLALVQLGALASATITNEPVSKIIEMLNDLAAKSEEEGKTETLDYEKFEYWCGNSQKMLNKAIKEEKEHIVELESTIEGLTAQEETLTEEIAALTEEIGDIGKADTKATFERGEEAKLYRYADSEFTGTITAIDNALTALETAETNTDTGFLQTQNKVRSLVRYALALASSRSLTEQQHSVVSAFLQGGTATTSTFAPAKRPDFKAAGNRTAHVKKYSFKSNSVIELLKELKQKFEDDELENTKAETNAINAYELAKEARDDLRDAKTKSKTAKSTELGTVQGDLATAKADLVIVKGDLNADSNLLKTNVNDCELKKTEWAGRCQVREMELEALAAAVKIMAKATNLRTEKPENPVPPPSPHTGETSSGATLSFLQLDPTAKAIKVLRTAAHAEHSKALDLLAQQISVGAPFDKVNNMIEKMIFRLMDEQKDEDNHKNWCDKELSKTNSSLEQKEDKMSDLNGKIATAKGREATLTREIGEDRDMVAKIDAHIKEAAEIRAIGKKENAVAVKEAKEAQGVIADAIAVLEDFYKESGMLDKEDWEFIQNPVASITSDRVSLKPTPSTWSPKYKGVADPSDPATQPKGIVTVLKATSADFATMEADTLAQEATDQSTYEDDMKACAIEKAGREESAKMKANEKKRLTAEIEQLNDMLKDVSAQHEATEKYMNDLQPACVDGDSTYGDRKAARTKEIEALRQAQGILQNAFNAPAPASAFLQAAAPAAAPSSFLQQKRR